MALVKVKVTCSVCKCEHEKYDESQFNDREKYLWYWNLPFEGKEADEAWEAKQKMTKQQASFVIPDIQGYISQVDGTWIDSRSKHRSHLKQHRMIEVGNDVPMQQKQHELSKKSQEARKRAIAEATYAKLKY